MRSLRELNVTVNSLESIVRKSENEGDGRKVRESLLEFERIFNEYCRRKLNSRHSLPCWGEEGCNCDLYKAAQERDFFRRLEELERRCCYEVNLGSF
jgi:hypothetical protein